MYDIITFTYLYIQILRLNNLKEQCIHSDKVIKS